MAIASLYRQWVSGATRRHRTEQAKAPETARFQAPFLLPQKNLMSFGREMP